MNINLVKITAILAFLIGSSFFLYNLGYKSGTKDMTIKLNKQVSDYNTTIENQRDEIQSLMVQLGNREVKIIEKEKEIINEVIKYVQIPSRTVCEPDSDWLHIRREILQNTDTRTTK